MAKLLKLRRGTTTQHASFTGAEGEVTIDTTKDTAVVHDGSTQAGTPLAKENMSNVSSTNIVSRIGTSALAGVKVQPNFGSQNVETTGTLTVSGTTSITGGILNLGTADTASGHLNSYEVMTFNIDSDNDDSNRAFKWYKDGASGSGTQLLALDESGTLTLGGQATLQGGAAVTGNITVSGTVDGRDVATDGSKLDGIESGATADQTATEILTSIKTVDGSGSGLDADTVDGIQGGNFVRSDQGDTMNGAYTINTTTNEHLILSGSNDPYIRWQEGATNRAYLQWSASDNSIYVWNQEENKGFKLGSTPQWYDSSGYGTIWHSRNDGSGSGLDADTVDGKHKTDFMQKGAPGSSSHYNADSWLEFDSNNGLYYPNNNAYHIYLDGAYFLLRNNQNYNGIAFNTNTSSRRGYVYADNGNNIGFLNTGGSWSLKCDNSGNVTATGNVTAYSDARLKTNVNTINDALSIVGKLRGVSFDWKESGKRSIGVIAQEVEEVLPELVLTQQVTDGEVEGNPNPETKEIKSVDYGKIVGVLINAINELKAEVDELKGGK